MGTSNKKAARIVISIVILLITITALVILLRDTGTKVGRDDSYGSKADNSDNIENGEQILSLDEQKLTEEVLGRLDELYKSNGRIYVSQMTDSGKNIVQIPVVLRETGEAYRENGSDIRVYLNNRKAVIASNPIEIVDDIIPMEIIKGMIDSIKIGKGKIERVKVQDGSSAIKLSIDGAANIVQAYSYVSEDYGWKTLTNYNIKENDAVEMSIYLYDKTESTTSDNNELAATWVQFRCECAFFLGEQGYAAWWTSGADSLGEPFELDEKIYSLTADSSIDIWSEVLTKTSNSIKELLSKIDEESAD